MNGGAVSRYEVQQRLAADGNAGAAVPALAVTARGVAEGVSSKRANEQVFPRLACGVHFSTLR
jgi:hypothetical protein